MHNFDLDTKILILAKSCEVIERDKTGLMIRSCDHSSLHHNTVFFFYLIIVSILFNH